jgi:hypothetical protein
VTDLPNNTYTFRLPWRPGAKGVTVGSATTFLAASVGTSGPNVQSAANQGLLVSFTLPTPQFVLGICTNCNRINGEIHLNWQAGQGPAPIPATAIRPRVTAIGSLALADHQVVAVAHSATNVGSHVSGGTADKGSPEEAVASLLIKASNAKRSQYLAMLPKRTASLDGEPLKPSAVTPIQALPKKTALARHRQFQSVPDPAKTQKNQLALDAVHKLVAQ